MEASAPEGGVSVGSEPPEFNQGQPQPSREVNSSTGEREAPSHSAAPLPEPEGPRPGESVIQTQERPSNLTGAQPETRPEQPEIRSTPPSALPIGETPRIEDKSVGQGANEWGGVAASEEERRLMLRARLGEAKQ